jgi:hypothetical protein
MNRHSVAQAVNHTPLSVEADFEFQASDCGNYGGRSGTEVVSLSKLFSFLFQLQILQWALFPPYTFLWACTIGPLDPAVSAQ